MVATVLLVNRRLDNIDSTPAQRWIFLAVISLGLLMIGVDNSILYTALPELRAQLGATETQALWIINAYPLVLAGLLLGTGTLGDRIGHRLIFLIGLSIFGVASLAAAFAPSAWLLVAARALLGLGAATMMPATLALIRLTFSDERERNTAIGIWGSVAVIGAAAGPVVGGLLLEYFWWGSVFLINVPIVLVALLATIAVAPPNLPNPDKHWDALASLYALLTLSGLVLAIKELANPARSPWLLAVSVLVFLLGAWAFRDRQRRLPEPLLAFDVFRSRIFSGGVLAAVWAGSGERLPLFVLGLLFVGAGAGAIMSVSSTAIIGSAPVRRAGMAAGIESVSYEFGTLLSVAILGSMLPLLFAVYAVAGMPADPMTALADPVLGRAAGAAYDDAYLSILLIIAVVTASMAAFTAWCFRGNPKGAHVAQE